jgi:hypothetical protein
VIDPVLVQQAQNVQRRRARMSANQAHLHDRAVNPGLAKEAGSTGRWVKAVMIQVAASP